MPHDLPADDAPLPTRGRVYVSGIEAIVRLLFVQRWRDRAAGLRTGGFVSGYRGSPLGGLDEALWAMQDALAREDIRFQPGVNEDLAATAIWGSQQLHLTGESDYDGVFGLWYGKSPGVDRCGDVFKHMAHAGTAPRGGVLLIAGDDHAASSSSLPGQSEQLFIASSIPILYPAGVGEYVELGLHGYAMSRFAGVPIGFKALADTVEASASIDADPAAVRTEVPEDFQIPPGGVHIRTSATITQQARDQESLMQRVRLQAVMAYARRNRLNHVAVAAPRARLGVVASGKAYTETLEALELLGLLDAGENACPVRLFKVAMPWPLEPTSLLDFAEGLDEILVIEEKRAVIEPQIKELLYDRPDGRRPRVVGKFAEQPAAPLANPDWLVSPIVVLSVSAIARILVGRLGAFTDPAPLQQRLAWLDAAEARVASLVPVPARPPWYCAGCPHNTSTRVPEGSLALAGIGCHAMATLIYPKENLSLTHMGGEGMPWLGQAPFSRREHVFVNLGDGTYFHSGSLAIRAAVAAQARMTYKILYNDAVAMTGGQPVDGPIGVPEIVEQLVAEGVTRIAVVADDEGRWVGNPALKPRRPQVQLSVHGRAQMDAVQRELRDFPGPSVLIYDQVCAAEKRRRSKKTPPAKLPTRAFINEAVCEGCGDCGVQSNCVALSPLRTSLGSKRQVDQSACNTDLSCVQGFCPSFVTVEGVTPRRKPARAAEPAAFDPASLPEPQPAAADGVFNVLITGIGGTGVITVGKVIGLAAHLEGRRVSVLDMTGMSQKNGAVSSHVRIAGHGAEIRAPRISPGQADLLIGCDVLTAAAPDSLRCLQPGRTRAVLNSFEQVTGKFAQDAEWRFPAETVRRLLGEAVGGRLDWIDATTLAQKLFGDAIGANLFLLGFAVQQGGLPLPVASLLRAIELNGVAVSASKAAFHWGRRAAVDLAAVQRAALPVQPMVLHRPPSLAALLKEREAFLTAYQDAAYAASYRAFVDGVAQAGRERAGAADLDRLLRAVAEGLFKLMAYKDEYEVARLYSHPDFRARLAETFEGRPRLSFHLAPPLFARAGPDGRPRKIRFGGWVEGAMRGLARLRRLRGTVLDPFGHTAERREERQLVVDYRQSLEQALACGADFDTLLALARLPERIRGYGPVKQAALREVRAEWARLLASLPPTQGGSASSPSGGSLSRTLAPAVAPAIVEAA